MLKRDQLVRALEWALDHLHPSAFTSREAAEARAIAREARGEAPGGREEAATRPAGAVPPTTGGRFAESLEGLLGALDGGSPMSPAERRAAIHHALERAQAADELAVRAIGAAGYLDDPAGGMAAALRDAALRVQGQMPRLT